MACEKSQEEFQPWLKAQNQMLLPSEKQLELNKQILPRSLLAIEPISMNTGLTATEDAEVGSNGSVRNKVSKVRARENQVGTEDFDPFSALLDGNNTESNCGFGHVSMPPIKDQLSANAFCFVAVVKLALLRGVSHYSNFSNLLPEMAEQLNTGGNIKGSETEYQNMNIQSYGADGVRVKVFFDDCVNQRIPLSGDAEATDFCTTHLDSAIYHRVKLFPIVPLQPGVTSDTAIAKMEWVIQTDSSVDGEMVISRNMMSEVIEDFTPKQMQFDYHSDAAGEFKEITIKFERDIDHYLINSGIYYDEWAANVLQITRIPGTVNDPPVWTVRGSLLLRLDLSNSQIFYTNHNFVSPDIHQISRPRLFFSAVAEDVFNGGNAMFSTILADDPALNLNDFPESEWDSQFHMWAAYKKLLKYNHTEDHYLNEHRIGGGSSLHMFEKETARPVRWMVLAGHADSVNSLDISPNGLLAVSGSDDGNVVIWDIDPSSPNYKTTVTDFPAAHAGQAVHTVAFHPTDNDLILSAGADGYVRVFSIGSGFQQVSFLQLITDPVANKMLASWSADGSKIASGSDAGANVWDVSTGLLDATLDDGFSNLITAIQFHPSDINIVLTAHNQTNVYRWDITSPTTPINTYSHEIDMTVKDASFSPDGLSIVSVISNGPLYRWSVTDDSNYQEQIFLNTNPSVRSATAVQYSSDGSFLALKSGDDILIYEFVNQTTKQIYIGNGGADEVDGLVSYTLLPGDTEILVGHNGAINSPALPVDIDSYKIESRSRKPVFVGHTDDVLDIVFSPDAALIATSSKDDTVRVWDATNGTLLQTLTPHTDWVVMVRFSPAGDKLISASRDGTARVWNTSTWLELSYSPITHPGGLLLDINTAEFSPDGTLILTAGDDDTARIWDAETGTPSGVTSSIRNATYEWIPSAVGTNEYYLRHTAGNYYRVEGSGGNGTFLTNGNPFFSTPDEVSISSITANPGTLGTLANNEWAFGNNDGLGFSTVYIRTDGGDPDLLAIDDVMVKHNFLYTASYEVEQAQFSPTNPKDILINPNFGSTLLLSAHNLATSRCVLDSANEARFTPDGERLFTNTSLWINVNQINPAITPFCYGAFNSISVSSEHYIISPDSKELLSFRFSEVVSRYDIDESSPTYKQPLTPGSYFDQRGYGTNPQDPRASAMAYSPDGTIIVTAEDFISFDSSRVDYDSYFAGRSDFPDETNIVNPYYVEQVASPDEPFFLQGCYSVEYSLQPILDVNGDQVFDTDGNPLKQNVGDCTKWCADESVGGCLSYSVLSQHDYELNGQTPDPEKFGYLQQQLDLLSPKWLLDGFIEKVID